MKLGNMKELWSNTEFAPVNQEDQYNLDNWWDRDKSPTERSDWLDISQQTWEVQMQSAIEAVKEKDWDVIQSLLNDQNLQPTVAEYIVINSLFSDLIKLSYTTISPATADIILQKQKDTVLYKDDAEKEQILNTLEFLQEKVIVK